MAINREDYFWILRRSQPMSAGTLNTIMSYDGTEWTLENQNLTRRRSDFAVINMNTEIVCMANNMIEWLHQPTVY